MTASPSLRSAEPPMQHRVVSNVHDLPTYAHGHSSPIWWGTLGFCVVEGMGFALAIGAYFYLVFVNGQWPLSAPLPDLFWSSLHTVLMLASLWPNHLAKKSGEEEKLAKTRLLLVIMSLIGVALLGLRAMEFWSLHAKWDHNAYGSILWLLLGFHTAHLLTDVMDTLVLAALMFTRHGHGKRFSDVGDNAFYWYFVVGTWIPIYSIIYWLPRWWS